MNDFSFLAMVYLPGVLVAVAFIYLAYRSRHIGSYLLAAGSVGSFLLTLARNLTHKDVTELFDASGQPIGAELDPGQLGLWLTYAQIPMILLTAAGALLLARRWPER